MSIRRGIKRFIGLLTVTIVLLSMTVPAFAYEVTEGFVAQDTTSGNLFYVQQYYTDATQPILDMYGDVRWVDENGHIVTEGWWQGRSLEDPTVKKWYYIEDAKAVDDVLRKSNGRWYLIKNRYMHTTEGFMDAGSEYPDRYVYVTRGGGLFTGRKTIDGHDYYFGAMVNSDGDVVPVTGLPGAISMPNSREKLLIGYGGIIVDPANDGHTGPAIYEVNSDRYAVIPGGYLVVNEDVVIDGIVYRTDSDGKIISSDETSVNKLASGSNAS